MVGQLAWETEDMLKPSRIVGNRWLPMAMLLDLHKYGV